MTTTNNVDGTDFAGVSKNNFQQMENKAIKIGYADGVNDGRESVFQKGFDNGYRDGLSTAFGLEKFRYFFNHLNTDNINYKDLAREKEQYKRISVMDLKSLQIKDNCLNLLSQEYVEEAMKKYAQKMPVATNLLNVQSSTTDLILKNDHSI